MGVRERFVEEILSWENTLYSFEGCAKGFRGCTNCASFFLDAITKIIPDGDQCEDGWNWTQARFLKEQRDIIYECIEPIMVEVPIKDIKPGDVVLFKLRRVSQMPAIYIGNDFFVYCNTGAGVIVKDYLPGNWKKRISHVLRFNRIEEE